MNSKYQVIILGSTSHYTNTVIEVFYRHIHELGLKDESINIIKAKNFTVDYSGSAPAFCLYFGDENSQFKDLNILDALLADATMILPVVSKLSLFTNQIPEVLQDINGFELYSINEVEKLVACILEGLSLLRLSRRLFISYKRDESTSVAIQLFEQLEKNGFDVFLDTHSIRPGEPFQDELWHRMADTDVVVLLNTPGFLSSHWTTLELAKANSMSIGILQLIWPNHKLERDAELTIPFNLNDSDFVDGNFISSKSLLTSNTVNKIVSQVESLRARSLASRQDNMISEFITSANTKGVKVTLQSEKFIVVTNSNGQETIVIPTVGVPQAFTYNQSEELVSRIKSKGARTTYLLYDHINIREKWLKHLSWLDNYLPIKAIKILDIEEWLKKF